MQIVTMPYRGELLVAHLAAYGLAVALEAIGVDAYVGHDHESLSFEPTVAFDAGDRPLQDLAATAVRRSANDALEAVEADVEPGRSGNDRRAVIWARASFANDPGRSGDLVQMRATLIEAAVARDLSTVEGLLAGLGASASWGPETVKPAHGATLLDGVLGNHTSDLVRGVLRPARAAAAAVDGNELAAVWECATVVTQLDKSGWAPPGTAVDLVHQWLAALGLSLLPVAHRPVARSCTPACWMERSPRRDGITLPLLARPASLARLRALVGLQALVDLADHDPTSPAGQAPAAVLRGFGVDEAVYFERLVKRGSGTSLAFSFRSGRRLALG